MLFLSFYYAASNVWDSSGYNYEAHYKLCNALLIFQNHLEMNMGLLKLFLNWVTCSLLWYKTTTSFTCTRKYLTYDNCNIYLHDYIVVYARKKERIHFKFQSIVINLFLSIIA